MQYLCDHENFVTKLHVVFIYFLNLKEIFSSAFVTKPSVLLMNLLNFCARYCLLDSLSAFVTRSPVVLGSYK